MDVRRRRVEPELDAQRPALRAPRQLALERALRAGRRRRCGPGSAASVGGVGIGANASLGASPTARRLPSRAAASDAHRSRARPVSAPTVRATERRPDSRSRRSRGDGAAARRRASRSCALLVDPRALGAARARLDGLRDDDGGRLRPARPRERARSSSEAHNSRPRRPHGRAARHPDERPEPRARHATTRSRPSMQQRDHRDRGQALLHQRAASTSAASRRAFVAGRDRQAAASRAARRSPSSSSRTRSQAQDKRTIFEKLREAALAYHLTRKWSKQKILTRVPELDLLRQRRLRDRVGGADVLRPDATTPAAATPRRAPCAAELEPARGRAARRRSSPRRARTTRSRTPSARQAPAQPRAARHARAGLHHAREYDDAVARGDADQRRHPAAAGATTRTPYFTTWVKPAGRRPLRRRSAPFEGGLQVQTTLDLDLQQAAQHAITPGCPAPAGPTRVAGGDRQPHRRGARDGRRRATTTRSRSTSPPRASASPARRSSRSCSPRRSSRASARTRCGRRRSDFNVRKGGTRSSSSTTTTTRTPGTTTLATRPTFSDNSVFAAGRASRSGTQKVAAAGAPDGHPHAGLAQLRDHARRPPAGRHAARHGPRLPDVRARRQGDQGPLGAGEAGRSASARWTPQKHTVNDVRSTASCRMPSPTRRRAS